MVLETDYIGTLGRKLLGILNANTFDGRTACLTSGAPYPAGTPCGNAGFVNGFSSRRINTTIGSDNFRTNAFGSNYHGFQASLRKRYSFGLQFNANYTYSKTLDELSDAFRAKAVGAFNACALADCTNAHVNYGPADFDVRHRGVVSYNYDLPFAKGSRWLGGWQVNGVFSVQTGVPVPVYDLNNDLNADGVQGADRPQYASGFNGTNVIMNRSPGIQFLKPAGYATASCPVSENLGLWCNSPMHRNDVYGPHYANLDLGLGKSFKITEGSKLTFFANFFNIFNHPNFDTPQGNFSDPNAFGKSQSTVGNDGFGNGHRIGQLALRFDF